MANWLPDLTGFAAHPHEKLRLPTLRKLTHSLAPVTYQAVPALPALSAKLSTFFAANTSPSLLEPTAATLTKRVIAHIATLPAPPSAPTTPLSPGLADAWKAATLNALAVLPTEAWFPVLDLWRIGLARDGARLAPAFAAILSSVLSTVASPALLDSPDGITKPVLLTALRLVSNALPFDSLVGALLSPDGGNREATTRLVVRALLDADKGVRSAGAGLAWSLVGRVWQQRKKDSGEMVGGEEWEVEVACAVLEALGREEESVEVGQSHSYSPRETTGLVGVISVHRLAASLGLLTLESPHTEAVTSILGALEGAEVIEGKMALCVGKADVESLLREVKTLIS